MDPHGRLSRAGKPDRALHLHRHPAGLKAAAARCAEGPFSTNVLWDRAIEEGRLFGIAFTGRWFEVGTPQAIRRPNSRLADGLGLACDGGAARGLFDRRAPRLCRCAGGRAGAALCRPGFGLARLTLLLPSSRAARTMQEAFIRHYGAAGLRAC
jgi:hypothetical protein